MKGLRFFFCTLLLIGVCRICASEYSVRNYLDSHKGSLHPVEGIWQSTDGFKYGIICSNNYSSTKSFTMEVLSTPFPKTFPVGDNKGTITEGSVNGVYSLEYVYKEWYEDYYGNITNIKRTIQNLILTQESYVLMSFQRLDGKTVSLYKLYPKEDSNQSNSSSAQSTGKSSGTGFFVSSNGYIITNNHVVEGARNIKVTKVNGDSYKKYNAKVEVSDKQNDLAIIKITDPSFSSIGSLPYTFKFMAANVGEDCFVLGYPLVSTMGTDIKLTNGVISSRTGFNGSVSEYQMSAPVQPGNSGGPLFDKNGNIIGVVCAKHTGAENAGYAVKASYIRNLVELLPQNINFPQTNQLAGKTLPKQVELASKAVCLIIVNGD
jgi:S1-C subfamily serine protease